MKTYISITILPSRLHKTKECIKSLINQTTKADKILVYLPKTCTRTGDKTTNIPDFLKHEDIEIHMIDDLGSISKIYFALEMFKHEDCNIITVDDDVKYPPNFVRRFLKFQKKYPDSALCYRGRQMDFNKIQYNKSKLFRGTEIQQEVLVDIVTGTWGALYKPSFFKEDFFKLINERSMHMTDDIWIAGHLAKNNVKTYVIPIKGEIKPLPHHNVDSLWQQNKNGVNNNKSIQKFKKHFIKNQIMNGKLPDKYKGVGKSTTFKSYGQTIKMNHHIDHIGRGVTISKNFYEIEMLDYIKKNIKKRGTYIDVGANIGNHTVFFAKFCADKVIAIEPVKENFELLEKNIIDNNLTNCVLHEKGISKDGRSLGVNIVPLNMGSCDLTEEGDDIQTMTVDELELDEITLIKIDCEGMSMEVLKSFLPLIKKYKPHVFVEATKAELSVIQKLTGYKVIGKFNATPTYYLKP